MDIRNLPLLNDVKTYVVLSALLIVAGIMLIFHGIEIKDVMDILIGITMILLGAMAAIFLDIVCLETK